jgi:Fe-S-cluster containining protein
MNFNCKKCGHCCKHLLTINEFHQLGIYLEPDEIHLFPQEYIKPLFIEIDSKGNKNIKAYQLDRMQCPNLSINNTCLIYDKRPKICRGYPIISFDLDRMMFHKHCSAVKEAKKNNSPINFRSLEKELSIICDRMMNGINVIKDCQICPIERSA